MREVTLRVEDLDSFSKGALAIGRRLDEGANKVGVAKLAFESMAGLLKLLTANRWTLMATLRKLGPVSIRAPWPKRWPATIAAFMPTSHC